MEFSGEARTFLSIMLTGAALGCIFDIYRVTRNTFKLRNAGTMAADILYWMLAVAIVFSVLVAVNWGQIRFYVFIALVVGAVIYFRYFSRYVLSGLIRLIKLLNKVKISLEQALKRFFLIVLAKPACFIFKMTAMPFLAIGRALKDLFRRLKARPPEDKL